MKQYMVIERIKPGCVEKIYERLFTVGRGMPEGLQFVDSWLTKDRERCFQMMETDDPATFDGWIAHWDDLMDFEVVEIGEKPTREEILS